MKKLILLLALALGMSHGLHAATPTYTPTVTPNATQTPHVPVYDNSSQVSMTAATNNFTWAYSVGSSGVSPALLVHVGMPLLTGGRGDYVSSVTYAGVPMVKLLSTKRMDLTTPYNLVSFYLMQPATGSNNVVVTLSVTENAETMVTASSYFNVLGVANISSATGTTATSSGSLAGTIPTGTAGGILTGGVLVDCLTNTPTLAVSNPAQLTSRIAGLASGTLYMSVADVRNLTPASTTFTWTWTMTGSSGANLMNFLELVPR